MSVNRYPMYLPKPESIDPNKFLWIKGPMAQQARHSWRFLLYVTFASQLGKWAGSLYSQPIAAKNSANDPKLAQFTAELRDSMLAKHRETAQARGSGSAVPQHQTPANPDGTQAKPPHAGAPRLWTRSSPATSSTPASMEDDMSPTYGNEPWPTSGSYGDSAFHPDTVEDHSQLAPSDRKSTRLNSSHWE